MPHPSHSTSGVADMEQVMENEGREANTSAPVWKECVTAVGTTEGIV